MAAAVMLHFQKFKILTVDPLPGVNMCHPAKFHQNWSNGRRHVAISRFFQNGGRLRHLGFVGRLLGPSTMTTWWSLSLCQIWLKSMQ